MDFSELIKKSKVELGVESKEFKIYKSVKDLEDSGRELVVDDIEEARKIILEVVGKAFGIPEKYLSGGFKSDKRLNNVCDNSRR